MKRFYWLFTLLILSTQLFAQPANDDCSGLIDLGTAPICPAPGIYNNVDATTSNIGNDNFPPCFVGLPDRDVWFSFTAVAGFEDLVIELTGTADGMGNSAITNPQIAVYRGDCEFDGLVFLECGSAANGENNLSVPLDGLTPGITYFIRINDWSATADSNAGAFELCIKVPPPIFTMLDGSTTDCSGTVYDSGGPDGDYSNNENLTFTICPDQPNGCINLTLTSYSMEDGFDDLFFFDGDNTNAPEIGAITGIGSTQDNVQGVCYQVSASSGCLTILLDSDQIITAPGFEAVWECTTEDCPTPDPLEVTPNADFAALEAAFSSPIMDVTVTSVTCPEDAYGTFLATDNTGLGLNEGILLTTGEAQEVANPGTFFANNDLGAPGDPELDILSGTGIGQNTSDVCVVEMDVFAKSNKIQFDYIFGSEEWKQNFSFFSDDLIAILASGNGIVGDPNLNMQENLAVLPTTGEIVSVQTVNGGNNWEYYRDNVNSQTIAYNGLTVDFEGEKKYLTAATEVEPCDTYHVKFMIGDTDENDDSGLFIAPSKEGVPEIAINFQTGIDYLVEGCTNIQDLLEFTLSSASDIPLTFDLEIGGTATLGEDYLLTLPNEISFAPGETKLAFPISAIADIIPEGTETIEISLISDFGCGAVVLADFTVEIEEELKVDIENGADTVFVCNDISMTQLEATGSAAYAWTPANLFDNATISNPTVTIATSQLVMVTGSLGTCTATDEIYLQLVEPEVEIELIGNEQICQGESVTLIANNNVNNSGLTWNPTGSLSNPDSETTQATPQFTTTYQATVEATEGCVATDEITITVEPFIVPVLITVDTTICQNSSVQLANATIGSSTTYEWSPIDGLDNPNISNAIATPETTTTYTLTSTSINGFCEETQEVMVTVLPANVEVSADTIEICLGDEATFSANTTTGGLGLTWSPADSLSSTTDITVTANPTISTWYVATLEIGECLVQDSVYIRVDSIPNTMIATVPERDMYCEGETISLISPTYLNLAYPDVEHFWQPTTGALSADTLFNLVVNATETTIYQRILQNNACSDTSEIEIIVVPTAEILITPENPVICPGESVDLTATSDDITEFTWSPSAGLSCTECATTNASAPQTITYTVEGEFMGCPSFANVTVEVGTPPSFNFSNETTICEGGEVDELNLLVEEPNTTYLWEVNGQFFSDEAQPSSGELTETTTFDLTIDNGECAAIMASITVNVINEPTLTVEFDETTICQGLSVDLVSNVNTPGGTFTWSDGNQTFDGFSITVTPDETTVYSLVYNSDANFNGEICFMATNEVTVNTVGAFILDSLVATPNMLFEGEDFELNTFIDPTGNQPSMADYDWALAGTIFETTEEDNISVVAPEIVEDATMEESFIYQVTITDEFGCVQTALDTIFVMNSRAEMPNAFTPNGDNTNDLFRLVRSPNVDVQDFRIYDRWGKEVYQLSENPDGWDGNRNDKAMPADVYFYIIEYNFAGRDIVQKGDVTLIR